MEGTRGDEIGDVAGKLVPASGGRLMTRLRRIIERERSRKAW